MHTKSIWFRLKRQILCVFYQHFFRWRATHICNLRLLWFNLVASFYFYFFDEHVKKCASFSIAVHSTSLGWCSAQYFFPTCTVLLTFIERKNTRKRNFVWVSEVRKKRNTKAEISYLQVEFDLARMCLSFVSNCRAKRTILFPQKKTVEFLVSFLIRGKAWSKKFSRRDRVFFCWENKQQIN